MSLVGPRPEQPEMVREPTESLQSRFRSRGDPTDTALGDMGNASTAIGQRKPAAALLVGGPKCRQGFPEG
ncbi:MAG: sugar transferase [Pseudomonadota bacterium]|nr:sugar transferase [Pseudomonadota bacterium]